MTRFSYSLREAFTNISRNGLVVLGAVLAVFVSPSPGADFLLGPRLCG